MLNRGRRASGARAAGAHAQDCAGSVTGETRRTRRSALDPHQRHRASPVRPEDQHADPRVTRPRGEFGGPLRRDCDAASTSEAGTLRGHGCAFLAPSPSVIEGSFDISGEFGGPLRRDCDAASTSEAGTLRGHGCAFLAPSPSVIEGSFDISEVDIHLGRIPRRLITDQLRSYAAAGRTVMITDQYANNRAEVSHHPTRQRERQMRRFTSVAQLQRFASVHGIVQNLFRVSRHLLRSAHHRLLRTRAFVEWDAVTCAC